MDIQYGRNPNFTRLTRQVFYEYKLALLAYNDGILNLTACARKIRPEIKKRLNKCPAKKEVVTTPTVKLIAAILSRNAKEVAWRTGTDLDKLLK